MEQIQISVVFPRIDPDRIGNFKQIAGKMLDITRGDPGNLQYDWFLNEDETRCTLRETYVDSQALLDHLPLINDLLSELTELAGGIEAEVFGNVSPDLRAIVEASGVARISRFFQGK